MCGGDVYSCGEDSGRVNNEGVGSEGVGSNGDR